MNFEYRNDHHNTFEEKNSSNVSLKKSKNRSEPDTGIILTVEVGRDENNNENNSEFEYDHNRNNASSTLYPRTKSMRPDDLDRLLNQYSTQLTKFGNGPTPHMSTNNFKKGDHPTQSHHSNSHSCSDQTFSMQEAESLKQIYVQNLNDSFQLFLEMVQERAKSNAHEFFKHLSSSQHNITNKQMDQPLMQRKKEICELLQTKHVLPVQEWSRKQNELEALSKTLEKKEEEWNNKLLTDLSFQSEPTVISELAIALNGSLSEQKENIIRNVMDMEEMQTCECEILKKMTVSYLTFNSWIIDQWNKNMTDISKTYENVTHKIQNMFQKDQTFNDLLILLKRYETFIEAHQSVLPMEFTLTMNPRKEWKECIANQQPEECIRLMQNEIKSLESIREPALQKSLQVWKYELGRYDLKSLQEMGKRKERIRKRLEDAVKMETEQTCQKRWAEVKARILKLGTGLQQESTKKFKECYENYKNKQTEILRRSAWLKETSRSYLSRLALMDSPWASWMEARKNVIKDWAKVKYWILSIKGLLKTAQVASEFEKTLCE